MILRRAWNRARPVVPLCFVAVFTFGWIAYGPAQASPRQGTNGPFSLNCKSYTNANGLKTVHVCLGVMEHIPSGDYRHQGFGWFSAANTGSVNASHVEERFVHVWSKVSPQAGYVLASPDWPDLTGSIPWQFVTDTRAQTYCYVHSSTQVRVEWTNGNGYTAWFPVFNSLDFQLPHPCGLD